MYRSRKIVFITIEEMNKRLLFCKQYRTIKYEKRQSNEKYMVANIEVKRTNVFLTYRDGGATITYTTRLSDDGPQEKITGVRAYMTLCHYYKVPNMTTNEKLKKKVKIVNGKSQISWIINSAIPMLWSNPLEGGKVHENCYEYDMISAYAWGLLQDIPNTAVEPKYNATVKKGEIGFYLNGDITFNGVANVVFPLMKSPFEKFVTKWFGIKKYGKGEEKIKAKQMLNFAVGYMQRTNPFIRNTIVNRCTNRILELMDENTLYCNTDCLVSKVKRDDLDIGANIGQFKIEHEGKFTYIGFNYQWNDEVPTYRGVVKKWFENWEKKHKRKWTILDEQPPSIELNDYYYDEEKVKIIKNRRLSNERS